MIEEYLAKEGHRIDGLFTVGLLECSCDHDRNVLLFEVGDIAVFLA